MIKPGACAHGPHLGRNPAVERFTTPLPRKAPSLRGNISIDIFACRLGQPSRPCWFLFHRLFVAGHLAPPSFPLFDSWAALKFTTASSSGYAFQYPSLAGAQQRTMLEWLLARGAFRWRYGTRIIFRFPAHPRESGKQRSKLDGNRIPDPLCAVRSARWFVLCVQHTWANSEFG